MTTVKIIRKITGDLCRAVTLPGPRQCPLSHVTRYTAITVPVSELRRPRLREAVTAQGHTAGRGLRRTWGGGLLPSLPPLTCDLLEDRAHNLPPPVSTSTSEATRDHCRAWGTREGGPHTLDFTEWA